MRKKSHKLIKSILAEAVGDPQTGSHTWDIPHPQTAWEGLSAEQQAHVHSLNQQGRIHPEGHLHGWRPGTGPLFQRDFTGRSNEDYRNLHKRYKQELIDAGHDKKSAHETAARFISTDRQRAHQAGVMAHETAMRPIREEQKKQRQAGQNISGARQQQEYKQDSEKLFHSAMQGATDSADYYRTGGAEEREHEKRSNLNNIEVRHPQLSDEAKKHLGALTDFSRAAIHTGVWGGLQSAGKEFSKDAMEHWNKTFTGIKPKDANINHPLDIVPSLLKPEHLSSVLKRYSSHNSSGRSQHTSMTRPLTDLDQRPRLPINTGANATWELRTTIPDGHHTFHQSVRGLGHFGTSVEYKNTEGGYDIRDSIRSHITASLIPLHMGGTSPFKTTDNPWEKQQRDGEQKHDANFRKAVGAGLKHIWSIPNISDHDRDLLHRHFESQLRHHYVAAVANPRMFNQYHESMETARREREQAKREEQQRQRQSSGGSSSGGSSGGRRRRGEWPHAEKPHEILGVAPDASASDVRRAYRKLAAQHHPDAGGDPAMFIKAKDAHDHMMSRLNEWIVMLAEWVSKRYKK
jgi:DnaJ-domain-containing protein 1